MVTFLLVSMAFFVIVQLCTGTRGFQYVFDPFPFKLNYIIDSYLSVMYYGWGPYLCQH